MGTQGDDDDILQMFFDDDFASHAFVDAFLSSAHQNNVHEVSSSLLSRLDYYTNNITKELETTVKRLETLSENIPGTWSSDNGTAPIGGATKLEYYLETVGNAIRALETDLNEIDNELSESHKQIEQSNITSDIKQLQISRDRLNDVLKCFRQIASICNISDGDQPPSVITLAEFKSSLTTLEQIVLESLQESLQKESSKERNTELLDKIQYFTKLQTVFQNIDKFNTPYIEFVDKIKRGLQDYLSHKDIDDNELGNI